jgi:predicted ATPase
MIDVLERVALRFEREESPPQKLRKLEGFLVQYGLPLAEAVPLFAALLSLPLAAAYAPLTMSPEQQKQKTLHDFLTIFMRVAAQQPLLLVMEDLHWVDPSTLELLSLLVDQGPTARILVLLTCRPDFSPPWTGCSHLTQVTLPRLPRRQAVEMTGRVAHSKALPPEVVEQVVAKTDGVPLFVEELTKVVLESGLLQEREARYELTGPLPPLAIPAMLHDSLMARLDHLATVKGLAQLGATLGREFSYELLQAVSLWDEDTLQGGLHQLVAAEFLHQQGLPPQATYRFKHALIQDAAYQSLLRSTRQQYHQRIAQVLEVRFPETVETQPELLAHHYTEAGLAEHAIPYWQRAGQHASERSAHMEAISHLTKGLEMLTALPDIAERAQQELDLQIALGQALLATKGQAAPEVGHTYNRARGLCQQVGEASQLFRVLYGLCHFHIVRAELQTARALGEELLTLAQHIPDPIYLLGAHFMLGAIWHLLGEYPSAREHLEQSLTLYDPQQHHAHTFAFGWDLGVFCRAWAPHALWHLGYPDRALAISHEGLALAQGLSHPFSLAAALDYAAMFHQFRREPRAVHEQAEAAIALCTEQRFAYYLAWGRTMQGWAQVVQGQAEEGPAQMRHGLAALRATGAALRLPYYLALLAETCGQMGQVVEGLTLLVEALAQAYKAGESWMEAELHRLKGELLLSLSAGNHAEAEGCFHQALAIARRQHTKSSELRTAVSLARLWQRQGKCAEASELLAPIYGWFTEGLDTADLQEAKALLDELS